MSLSGSDMEKILDSDDAETLNNLIASADTARFSSLGNEVYMRGLIEFSNQCRCDCFYCGLRKTNREIRRYHLDQEQILELAGMAEKLNIPSIALQSGELGSDNEVDFIAAAVRAIREQSTHDNSPGLGITLSTGELTYAQYKKLFDAGAHRYLLRIESSNKRIFQNIHPASQGFEPRLECLHALKDIGYQVGTGIMIGLPGQSAEDLVQDLHFFVELDIDMLGMGPYIPHPHTPLIQTGISKALDPYTTTVKMLAMARLLMPDINMVVSTALQTINPAGLKMGVAAGGNVVMPVLTPQEHRADYSLYANKRFKALEDLKIEIESAGYSLAYGKWGDSRHYYRSRGLPYPDQCLSHEKQIG